MVKKLYPKIWPIAFLTGGILSSAWGGHLHFALFGEMVMVDLHQWMWFLMALAHADAYFPGGRHHSRDAP